MAGTQDTNAVLEAAARTVLARMVVSELLADSKTRAKLVDGVIAHLTGAHDDSNIIDETVADAVRESFSDALRTDPRIRKDIEAAALRAVDSHRTAIANLLVDASMASFMKVLATRIRNVL